MKHENVETFLSFLNHLRNHYGEKIALSTFTRQDYQLISYNQLVDDSKHFAKFLIKRKKGPVFKVAILAENNIVWSRYAFGALLAQAILIPMDIALSAQEVSSLLTHANPDLVIYSPEQEELMIESLKCGVFEIKILRMLEDFTSYPLLDYIQIEDSDPRRNALIVYTSGSSGNPKGVMLSEEAIIFNAVSMNNKLQNKNIVTLSMLPINHMLEFTAGLCGNLLSGGEICIARSLDMESLKRDFVQRRITQMITVPLLLTKIREGIQKKVRSKGLGSMFIFHFLSNLSRLNFSDQKRRKLFGFIHKNLAPHLNRLIVGGAKTSVNDLIFFDRLGIPVYEGYGLTETAPVIAVNAPGDHRYASVGHALPGVKIRINHETGADHGEIQVRGKNVMMGYYQNEQLTKESFTDDAWFKTGDLGAIDKDGFLEVNGRIKSLIVLEGGKKIHPEEIEELLNSRTEIKEASVNAIPMKVNGKTQTQIAYIIVPSEDFITSHDNHWKTIEISLIAIVNDVVKLIAPYKRANKIFISQVDLPKTSTQKIKQSAVKALLAELINNADQTYHC